MSTSNANSSSRLWNLNSQTRHIYGWQEILENWSNDLTMNPYVQTVLDNLRVAADPDSNYDYPLSHFLTFLNNEDEGIKWLLYEAVAMRWMWGNIRLDYVRDLVTRVDLNSTFPTFVGSPGNTMTISQFLCQNLTDNEREMVFGGNLWPRSSSTRRPTYVPPALRQQQTLSSRFEQLRQQTLDAQDDSSDSSSDSSSEAETEALPEFVPWKLRFLRAGKKDRPSTDDILTVKPDGFCSFTLTYYDGEDKIRRKQEYLTRQQVLRNLSITLRLLTYDEDPFKSVQVEHPALPTILLKPRMDSQLRDIIYDSLESCCDSWPTAA